MRNKCICTELIRANRSEPSSGILHHYHLTKGSLLTSPSLMVYVPDQIRVIQQYLASIETQSVVMTPSQLQDLDAKSGISTTLLQKPSFPLDHVRGGPVLLDSPKQYLKRLSDGAKSQSDWHLMRWAVAIRVMRVGSDTFGDPLI